jgi:threonine dehydrogenase-like Zn-dependent dehydrogenase
MSEEFMLAFSIVNAGDMVGKVVSIPKPKAEPGFALIKVLRAGVCNTDLEILKGYMGFQGVLGHEFVGIVEDVESSDDDKLEWIGKRVCGDINVGCATCSVCTNSKHLDQCCSKMSRNHCPNRTVLGILNRNGTMAEYLTLPIRNLHIVPDDIPDEVAVFAEPLAAACRILEQGLINYADVDSSLSSSSSYVSNTDRVAILGDGKLGLLIAEVLGREHTRRCPPATPKPTLFGKHPHKLDLVAESGVERKLVSDCQDDTSVPGNVAPSYAGIYDVVIDATGSPSGLTLAAGLCRPMGTLVRTKIFFSPRMIKIAQIYQLNLFLSDLLGCIL